MERTKTIAASLVAAAVMTVAACGTSQPTSTQSATATTGTEPAYAATLEPLIDRLMKDNAIPGAVVLITSPDQGDWSATFGTTTIDENKPMSMDDHFRIGSNTKTMTSTVILQLVQEGRLSLDDPVSKYRPGVPNGDKITIAQLSDMHSGLYSYTFDPQFNATLDRDPDKVWTPDELLAIAFSHPVNFPPGEKFDYSNTNIILLGVIIEQLTGRSAAEAFAQRIFEPLGLEHTSLPAPADSSIPEPHPQGYSFGTNVSTIDTYALPADEQAAAVAGTLKPNNETNANPSWAWTAGGAISTVADMATYVKALVGGGLLDEQTQKIRLDSIQPTDPANPTAAGYGLGIARFGPLIGHDGQIPGFMTFMGMDPNTDLRIVIGTNLATVPSGEGSALTLLKGILPVFYGAGSVPAGNPAAVPGATGGASPTTTPVGGATATTGAGG
ncbi:serine hydrolase [Rhodococcus sp. ACPA1]|uniref:serine hydrolase domain-containing protein n=1 Tax=Rhodococcus sp. ACPA1 TaxID=2028572 RepID=UPI000BB12D3C|nr:serine hydrolase domain-containing protein [Rhodococcus sp. ACPA1]PBC45344.1 D-alanyl-D-alanine carboxypeptidase [Rhodococcus sp. ACPA1]